MRKKLPQPLNAKTNNDSTEGNVLSIGNSKIKLQEHSQNHLVVKVFHINTCK